MISDQGVTLGSDLADGVVLEQPAGVGDLQRVSVLYTLTLPENQVLGHHHLQRRRAVGFGQTHLK